MSIQIPGQFNNTDVTELYKSQAQIFILDNLTLIIIALLVAVGIPLFCTLLSCSRSVDDFAYKVSQHAQAAFYYSSLNTRILTFYNNNPLHNHGMNDADNKINSPKNKNRPTDLFADDDNNNRTTTNTDYDRLNSSRSEQNGENKSLKNSLKQSQSSSHSSISSSTRSKPSGTRMDLGVSTNRNYNNNNTTLSPTNANYINREDTHSNAGLNIDDDIEMNNRPSPPSGRRNTNNNNDTINDSNNNQEETREYNGDIEDDDDDDSDGEDDDKRNNNNNNLNLFGPINTNESNKKNIANTSETNNNDGGDNNNRHNDLDLAKEQRRHRNRYRRFLLKRRKYTGMKPWIYPKGNGQLEDYIRLLCNEHLVFAMIFADNLHPYSRDKRKIAFFCVTSVTFCLIVLFQFLQVQQTRYSDSTKAVWNLPFFGSAVVISPILLLLDVLIYQLVVCPCIVRKSKAVKIARHFISAFTQLGFLTLGIACFIVGIYLKGRYLEGSSVTFLIQQVIFGLLIWPTIGKALILFLPYIKLLIGGHTCLGDFYIVGGWYVEKRKQEEGLENDGMIEVFVALICNTFC